jgi:hypothetical protein
MYGLVLGRGPWGRPAAGGRRARAGGGGQHRGEGGGGQVNTTIDVIQYGLNWWNK